MKLKLLFLVIVGLATFSCSEKKGMDKIKGGMEDVKEGVEEEAEEASTKKIQIKLK